MSANPNVPAISPPIANTEALTSVVIALRAGVQSLSGQIGGPLDRAITFNDISGVGQYGLLARLSDLEQAVALLAARQLLSGDSSLGSLTPNITSTTYIMAGMGVHFIADQTRAIAHIDGQIGNNANNGTTYVQLVGGSGPIPARGDPIPPGATTLGQPVRFLSASANDYTPFAQAALLSGPTGMGRGTQHWVDIAVRVGSGAATLTELYLVLFELLDPLVLPP